MNDFAFLNLFGTLSSRSHHPLGSSGPLRRRWVPCQGWPKAWMCSDPVNPWRIFLFMGDMNQNQSIIFLLVIIQWKPYEEFWIWDLFFMIQTLCSLDVMNHPWGLNVLKSIQWRWSRWNTCTRWCGNAPCNTHCCRMPNPNQSIEFALPVDRMGVEPFFLAFF